MMFLLDTNAFSDLMRKHSKLVLRYENALTYHAASGLPV